ncbi:unnamed protein product, partial [Staurois parvus]
QAFQSPSRPPDSGVPIPLQTTRFRRSNPPPDHPIQAFQSPPDHVIQAFQSPPDQSCDSCVPIPPDQSCDSGVPIPSRSIM